VLVELTTTTRTTCSQEESAKDSKSGVTVAVEGYTHRREYALSGRGTTTSDLFIGDQILRASPGTIAVSLVDVPPGKYKLVTYHNSGSEYCGICAAVAVTTAAGEKTEFVRTGNHMTLDEAMKVRRAYYSCPRSTVPSLGLCPMALLAGSIARVGGYLRRSL
jgi:hypothetical protein